VGSWLGTYGTAIYGTRGGPVPPRSWGATTRRGDTVFVHVLAWPDPLLALPPLGARVKSARTLSGGAAVPFQQSPAGVTLQLPRANEPIDRVVVLITSSR
jgi:alpha-L-fucosidase